MAIYFVEVEGNVMKNPAYIEGDTNDLVIKTPYLEVSKDFYDEYEDLFPVTFDSDEFGNISNIKEIPKPEPIPISPTKSELMEQEIASLRTMIESLVGGGE